MTVLQFQPKIRALNGWVTRRLRDYHNSRGGRWIVWCPTSATPPTRRWFTRSQAKAVAHRLSEQEPGGSEFIVCELHDVIGVNVQTNISYIGHSRRTQ